MVYNHGREERKWHIWKEAEERVVLLKMQGYSTKESALLVHLTSGAIYARLDHLRKKLRKIYSV